MTRTCTTRDRSGNRIDLRVEPKRHRLRRPGRVVAAALTWALLASATGCGGDETDLWPPALPCVPGPGVHLASEVSFDPERLLCIRLTMDPADRVTMAKQTRFGVAEEEMGDEIFAYLTDGCEQAMPSAYTKFPAAIDVEGVPLPSVSVRKKGLLGSVGGGGMVRPSMRVKVEDATTVPAGFSTEVVTLNNNLQDPSRLRTCLAYGVFAKADYPAPRCNLAAVMINDEPLGAYSHVEAVDRAFLRRVFGDDGGALYEGALADFTPDHLTGAAQGRLGRFEAKTSATDPKGGPLLALVAALQVDDDQLEAALGQVLDLDRFIRFWALETLIGHGDGYGGNRNNFYVYFDPGDAGRAVLLPWGADNVLGNNGAADDTRALSVFAAAELPRRLSRTSGLAARFEAELRRLLDTVWDEAALEHELLAMSALVERAQRDPAYDEAIANLTSWIRQRRGLLLAQLDKGLPAGPAKAAKCTELAGGFDFGRDGLELMTLILLGL